MADQPEGHSMRVDAALLRELAELLSANDLTEIEVEDGDRKIKVRREAAAVTYSHAPAHAPAPAPAAVVPAPEEPPAPAAPKKPGRDRYLDLLRSIALVRVVLYHIFGWAWLTVLFPSMGVMFALAGSLMARILTAAAAQLGPIQQSEPRAVAVELRAA